LVDLLRNLVIRRVGARLIRTDVHVRRVCEESDRGSRVERKRERWSTSEDRVARESRTDAIALDRLNLIFRLTWTIKNSEAAAQDRASATKEAAAVWFRRPRHRDSWPKVGAGGLECSLGRIAQGSVRDVEEHLKISVFAQRRVVLVTQTVVQREVRFDLPFIGGVADVVLLLGVTLTSSAAVEGTGRADVAKKLDRLRRIR